MPGFCQARLAEHRDGARRRGLQEARRACAAGCSCRRRSGPSRPVTPGATSNEMLVDGDDVAVPARDVLDAIVASPSARRRRRRSCRSPAGSAGRSAPKATAIVTTPASEVDPAVEARVVDDVVARGVDPEEPEDRAVPDEPGSAASAYTGDGRGRSSPSGCPGEREREDEDADDRPRSRRRGAGGRTASASPTEAITADSTIEPRRGSADTRSQLSARYPGRSSAAIPLPT